MLPQLLDTNVAAVELGLTRQQIYRYVRLGLLKASTIGDIIVFHRSEFDAFKSRYLAGHFDGRLKSNK